MIPIFYSAGFVIDWHTKESKCLWGEPASTQQLDKDFGTHEEADVIKIVIEKGEEEDFVWDDFGGDYPMDDSDQTPTQSPRAAQIVLDDVM